MTQDGIESKGGELKGFEGLGLDAKILSTLASLGYEEPTPIQRAAIPAVLTGQDVIGQAATGTGKTAAFALPLVQLMGSRGKGRARPSALVLVPTRELAMQVAEAVHSYGTGHAIKVVPVYGGQPYEPQIRALERGVDVVIATPGRAIDLISRGALELEGVVHVVLDEADEMLDMGFLEDIETILSETPDERQVVLFSATLPPRIAAIAKRYMQEPQRITVERERLAEGASPKVRQTAYIVGRAQKRLALSRLLDVEDPTSAIIFCRTRHEVDELAETLNAHGRSAEALHGGISQAHRERIIKKLKDGRADLVIATDVAARGLDIDQLTHVINFDVPSAPEAYVHRIGRVGRAGREGVALTLAEPREHRSLRNIEHLTKQRIHIAKLPTLADLRAMRLEQTRERLKQTITAGGLDIFQSVIESLAQEHDMMEVALAAVKLVYEADGPEQAVEIEEPRVNSFGRGPGGVGGGDKRPPRSTAPMTRLHVGVGSMAGVRPGDLVGAITAEAGISGRQIGAIQIADRFAVVEVETTVAESVLKALGKTTIKGRKVPARVWTEGAARPPHAGRGGPRPRDMRPR